MIRLALACLSITALSASGFAQNGDPATRLHTWLDPLVETRDFSGMIATRRAGQPTDLQVFGYADWHAGTRFDAETRIPAGPLTRGLTHALILQLARDGTIHLDDRLSRFIPEWPEAGLISIRDVLEDRAGLPQSWPPGAPTDGRSQEIVAWLSSRAIIRPGPHAANSSEVGETLLALIIERALSGRYETWVSARLLGPFDMNDSLVQRGRVESDTARYLPGPLPVDLRRRAANSSRLGETGLVTTMDDLLNWGEAVATRRADLFEADGNLHGGFNTTRLGDHVLYVASARDIGIATGLALSPQSGLTIAWMVNIDAWPVTQLEEIIPALVLGLPIEAAPVRPPTYPVRDDHRGAIGRYDWPGLGSVEISESGGALWLTGTGWRRYLTPLAEAALLDRTTNTRLDLVLDEDGRTVRLGAQTAPALGSMVEFEVTRTDLPPLEQNADN
jgi:CubicO group peptidase (beta-lactamase class C family)